MTTLARLAAAALILASIATAPAARAEGNIASRGNGGAAIVLADDGGLDRITSRTLRSLTATELRKHGLTVSDDQRFAGVQPVDEQLVTTLRGLGIQRLFVLRIGGKLGQKIPLALEEQDPERLSTVYAADLVATGLEESDRNLRRLVDAVLDRRPAADTAGMTTVTREEKRAFQKKPAEWFKAIGFPFGLQGSTGRTYGTPLGLSGAVMVESEFARIDLQFNGETHGSSSSIFTGLLAHWLPSDRQVTPYVGGGLGYLAINGSDGAGNSKWGGGMAAAVEVGVEAFRLQTFRLIVGVQGLIPIFDTGSLGLKSPVTPVLHVRFAF